MAHICAVKKSLFMPQVSSTLLFEDGFPEVVHQEESAPSGPREMTKVRYDQHEKFPTPSRTTASLRRRTRFSTTTPGLLCLFLLALVGHRCSVDGFLCSSDYYNRGDAVTSIFVRRNHLDVLVRKQVLRKV